jgi:hypothetical protein
MKVVSFFGLKRVWKMGKKKRKKESKKERKKAKFKLYFIVNYNQIKRRILNHRVKYRAVYI